MNKISRLFLSFWCVLPVSWDNLFTDIMDYMYPLQDGQELSETPLENLYDDLYQIYLNPININSTSKDQLEKLPFLSYANIGELEAYVYFNKGMLSLGEIQLVDGFDVTLSELLQPFLYIGPYMSDHSGSDSKNSGPRNDILAEYNMPLYKKADINYSTSIRYKFDNYKNIKFGITTQSDYGEHVYDFISPYFKFTGSGALRNLVAGNLRVSFGQGLIVNQGFSVYNSVPNMIRQSVSSSIKPHTGVSEYGYISGVGVEFQSGSMKFSAVAGYTPVDATVNKEGFVSSFKEDGYHRSVLESSKRHNTRQLCSMFHVEHSKEGRNLGFTASYTKYDRPLLGKVFKSDVYALDAGLLDIGTDFLINRSRYSIAAECAASVITTPQLFSNIGIAAFLSLGLKAGDKGSLHLVPRYYSDGYFSPYSGGFSKGNSNNEYGLYCSYSYRRKIFALNLYQDFYKLNNLICQEAGAQFDLTGGNSIFSLKLKSKYRQQHTWRFRFDWKCSLNSVQFQTSIHFCAFSGNIADKCEKGYAFQERITYKAADKIVLDFGASLFSTDSYSTRISLYEKGMLYSYGYSNYYGQGLRLSFFSNFKLDKVLPHLVFRFKVGSTIYFDRNAITSQFYYDIGTFHKEDLSFQLQYAF